MSSAAWKLQGRGYGSVGDDGTPCRNGWQAYGLYMTGTAAGSAAQNGTAATRNATSSTAGGTAGPKRTKNASKRQAVFDSDPDDPTAGAPPRPFQWLTKSFAFIKRMFTFVIVPFFKFVRNTFFQTRSLDDTVVDVSETHLTVSEVKFEPHSVPAMTPTTTTTAATTATATTAAAAPALTDSVDNFADDGGDERRTSSSAKRETTGGGHDRCVGRTRSDDRRVAAEDLLATGAAPVDDALSPNAKRYLRMISDGLNDVGVDVVLVRRAFACCDRPTEGPGDIVLIDWDRTRARPHNVTFSPHACGRS